MALAIKSLHPAQASAILALVCAGAFARVAAPVPHIVAPPPELLSGEKVVIVAHVTNDGALLDGGGPRERVDLQTEIIELDNLKFTQPVGIRATAFSRETDVDSKGNESPQLPRLAYGDRVRLTARLRLPRNFRNP